MSLEIKCAYCEAPLWDAEHARKHVSFDCPKAPDWRKDLAEASRLIFAALPEHCDAKCTPFTAPPRERMHEAHCAGMRAFLEKHPYDPGPDNDGVVAVRN